MSFIYSVLLGQKYVREMRYKYCHDNLNQKCFDYFYYCYKYIYRLFSQPIPLSIMRGLGSGCSDNILLKMTY